MSKTRNHYETTVETCCHRVAIRYWDFEAELTDELKERLRDAGEERVKECIIDGCGTGELNYAHVGDSDEVEEIRGWWEIIRD